MVYVLGITGGIASGKSSASKMLASKLEARGEVNLIDADKLGHLAYAKGSPAYHSLVEKFGAEKILADPDEGAKDDGKGEDLREIDRRKLGGIVFSDKAQMDALCQIVWPVIRSNIVSTIQGIVDKRKEQQQQQYVILEAAVMLEAGWDDLVTDMLLVTFVDRDLAKARLMERNSLSDDEALKRIDAQMSNSERLTRVCDNDNTSEVTFEDNNVIFYEGQQLVGGRLTVTLENKGSEDDLKGAVSTIVDRILEK